MARQDQQQGRDQGGREQGGNARGFASMDDEKQRAIAAEGERDEQGQFTSDDERGRGGRSNQGNSTI